MPQLTLRDGKGKKRDAAIYKGGWERRKRDAKFTRIGVKDEKRRVPHHDSGLHRGMTDAALFVGGWETGKERCATLRSWLGNEKRGCWAFLK